MGCKFRRLSMGFIDGGRYLVWQTEDGVLEILNVAN